MRATKHFYASSGVYVCVSARGLLYVCGSQFGEADGSAHVGGSDDGQVGGHSKEADETKEEIVPKDGGTVALMAKAGAWLHTVAIGTGLDIEWEAEGTGYVIRLFGKVGPIKGRKGTLTSQSL